MHVMVRRCCWWALAAGGMAASTACAQPVNDECADAIDVAVGTSLVFTNTIATESAGDPMLPCAFFGPSTGFRTVWFTFVATESSAVVSLCGSRDSRDTLLGVLAVGDPMDACGSLTLIACSDDAFCSGPFLSRTCASGLAPGQTYYVVVAGQTADDRGVLRVEITAGCNEGDLCSSAQPIACNTATTFNNLTDNESLDDPPFACAGGVVGAGTHWFTFVAADTSALISTCDSPEVFDTLLAVYSVGDPMSPCGTLAPIACNDDVFTCFPSPQRSSVCVRGLTVGATYYIEVAGYFFPRRGLISVAVACPCSPMCVTCPPEARPEGEPVCADGYVDSFNGGCNSTPAVFGPIRCGETICAMSGLFTGSDGSLLRDTDWYELDVKRMRQVWCAVNAEFPVVLSLIGPNRTCDTVQIRDFRTSSPCSPFELTAMLEPGRYWLVVAPNTAADVPCGRRYTISLECECVCRGDLFDDGALDGDDIQPFVGCLLVGIASGPCMCADLNQDGFVDDADLSTFVDALTNDSGCP